VVETLDFKVIGLSQQKYANVANLFGYQKKYLIICTPFKKNHKTTILKKQHTKKIF
jgi:hypothetical protein